MGINKIIVLLISVLSGTISFTSTAQNSSGLVKYQRIVNLDIESGGEWAEFKKTLPQTQTTNFILYFNENESVFVENSKENEAPTDMMKKAMYFAGKWGSPQVKLMKYYHNQDKNLQIKQTEFMTRLFREFSEMPKMKWKMGVATKEILGYKCMQAEIQIDDDEILAWFSADIPVSAGPEKYYGLPGLMLEVNVNHGEQVWLANSVDLKLTVNDQLFEPKEGKVLKPDQYKKIQEQKIAEWEKQQKMKKSDKVDYIIK